MSRVSRSVAIAMLLLVLPAAARADTLLAGFDYSGTLPAPIGDPQILPLLSYGDPTLPPATGFLDNVTLSFLDFVQGNTYELTGDLSNFVSLATNGIDDSMYVGFQLAGVGTTWSLEPESAVLASAFQAVPGLGNPDFAGYEITRVLVLGSSFSQGANELDITINFQVFGNRLVPEPGTWALLALGACGLVGYRGRQKRDRFQRRS